MLPDVSSTSKALLSFQISRSVSRDWHASLAS